MHTIKLFIKLVVIFALLIVAGTPGTVLAATANTSCRDQNWTLQNQTYCSTGTKSFGGGVCKECASSGWIDSSGCVAGTLVDGVCGLTVGGGGGSSSGGGGGGGGGSRPANTAGESIVNPVVAVSGTPTEAASKLINASISFLLIIAIIAALFFLIWGGVQYTTSGGDKAATQAARDKIVAALIGLALTFGAYLIAIIAGNFLGFDIGNLVIPSP